MRSVYLAIFLAPFLAACATVSMVASEATVETNLTTGESSLRKVSDAYSDLAEREHWVRKSNGLLGFAQVLMNGSEDEDPGDTEYVRLVADQYTASSQRVDKIRDDVERAAHGLDVATMEAEKLFGTGLSAKALRADLVSYESALVTAKKARRTFISTLSELDLDDANVATYALAEFDVSIDKARDAADELAAYTVAKK